MQHTVEIPAFRLSFYDDLVSVLENDVRFWQVADMLYEDYLFSLSSYQLLRAYADAEDKVADSIIEAMRCQIDWKTTFLEKMAKGKNISTNQFYPILQDRFLKPKTKKRRYPKFRTGFLG